MTQNSSEIQAIEFAIDSGPTEIRDLRDTLLQLLTEEALPDKIEVEGEPQNVSASTLQFLVAVSRTEALASVSLGPKATALRTSIEAL